MGRRLLFRRPGPDDPLPAAGNRPAGKHVGENPQNGASGKTANPGRTGRTVPQGSPPGSNAGLFFNDGTEGGSSVGIRPRSPEHRPRPGRQRLHFPAGGIRPPGPYDRGAIRPQPVHEAESPAGKSPGSRHGHVPGGNQKAGTPSGRYRFRQDGSLSPGGLPNRAGGEIRPDHGAGNLPDAPDRPAFQIPLCGDAFFRGRTSQPALRRRAL